MTNDKLTVRYRTIDIVTPVMIAVAFGVIFLGGSIVLSFIPLIGGLAVALLSQVILGGWMLSARKLEAGGAPLEVADLFSGFKDKLNALVVLGALALLAALVIGLVMLTMGGGAVAGMAAGGAAGSAGGIMAGAAFGLLAFLVGLLLGLVVAMAFWFAPALVVFRGVAPVEALKVGWSASLANIVPYLVYSVIWLVAALVASILFGLGWLVLVPLTFLGIYCAYQDIFEAASSPKAPGAV